LSDPERGAVNELRLLQRGEEVLLGLRKARWRGPEGRVTLERGLIGM
jgi:hypothetical protein